jgi:plastocyanin
MRCAWLVALSVMLFGVACGGNGSTQAADSPSPKGVLATTPAPSPSPSATTASPACSPSGTKLEISTSATATAFTTACLAAPAGEDFTITFHNRMGVPHDVSIATEGLIDILFEGKVVTGPTDITYKVKAIPAGTYTFYCKIHPTAMNGTFVVA